MKISEFLKINPSLDIDMMDKEIIQKYLSDGYSIRKIYILIRKTDIQTSELTLRNFIRKNNLKTL